MIWLLLLIAFVVLAIALLAQGDDTCPNCNRELDPTSYRGWTPGQRRFCPYCQWEED